MMKPSSQPAFNIPPVVLATIAVFFGVHMVQSLMSSDSVFTLLFTLSLIPAKVFAALGFMPDTNTGWDGLREAVLEDSRFGWIGLFTYGLLHASWSHVAFNSLWLVVFGTPVARRIGNGRFLLLLLMGSLAGGLLHLLVYPSSIAPVVGASAGVSALTGAAARFVFTQNFDIRSLHSAYRAPIVPLKALRHNRMALMFIAFWTVSNVLLGILSLDGGGQVAWEAHMGGFAFGLLMLPWFDRQKPTPTKKPPHLRVVQ
jgi:membrane associated rhomboid family serine protease